MKTVHLFLCCGGMVLLQPCGMLAQEIRRAEPVSAPQDPDNIIRLAPESSGETERKVSPEELQLDAANSLYLKQQFDAAAKEYENYLTQYPTAPEAHIRSALWFLAESHRRANQAAAAQDAYEKLLSRFTEGQFVGPANFQLAILYFNQKQYSSALPLFERSAILNAATEEVVLPSLYYKAQCLEKLGRKEEIQAVYTKILSSSLPNPNPYKGTALVKLLQIYYAADQYSKLDTAYKNFESTLTKEQKSEAMLLAANAQRQLKNYKQAETLYLQIASTFPNSAAALQANYQKMVILYATNDPTFLKEANTYLSNNTTDSKEVDQVKLMKADALFKQSKYSEAAAGYLSLKEGGNRLPEKYKAEIAYRLGYAYLQMKQPANAVTVLTEFVRSYSNSALTSQAYLGRALAYQQQKNYKKALEDFTTLVDQYPRAKEREVALYQQALLFGQANNTPKMQEAFRTLLKEFPHSNHVAEAHYYLANAAYDAKDFAQAKNDFEIARKLEPDHFAAKASLRIIFCNYQTKNQSALASEVDDYRTKNYKPDVPVQILTWLGDRQLKSKDFGAAEQNITAAANALPLTTENAYLWIKLARCQLTLQKSQSALASIEKYLKLIDGNTDPSAKANGLIIEAKAYIGLSRFMEAQKSLEDAMLLQPEGILNARARLLTGDIAYSKNRLDEASKAYLSIAIITNDAEITPEALRKAADTLQKLGKADEAAKTLEELKTRFPQSESAVMR